LNRTRSKRKVEFIMFALKNGSHFHFSSLLFLCWL
jgi:hypothetical protein